jgi:hypothetical protein
VRVSLAQVKAEARAIADNIRQDNALTLSCHVVNETRTRQYQGYVCRVLTRSSHLRYNLFGLLAVKPMILMKLEVSGCTFQQSALLFTISYEQGG